VGWVSGNLGFGKLPVCSCGQNPFCVPECGAASFFLHATSKLASANFLAVYPRTLSDTAHLIPPSTELLIKMNALRV